MEPWNGRSKNVRGRPEAGKERLAALTAALKSWSMNVHTMGHDKIYNRCTTLTVVGIDNLDPALLGLTYRQKASVVVQNLLHVANRPYNCCQGGYGSRIYCRKPGCDAIAPVFMSVQEYKRTISPAAFAAETERL